MTADTKNIHLKSNVWLEDRKGRIIFGLGRMRIQTAIEKCGSLNAAAKTLKMSYRALSRIVDDQADTLFESGFLDTRSTAGMPQPKS